MNFKICSSFSLTIILPVLLQVGNAENEGKEEAQGTHHNVADCQEVVLSSEGVGGGEHKGFATGEGLHIVLVANSNRILALLKGHINLPIKLAEVGEACGSHPDDEVL